MSYNNFIPTIWSDKIQTDRDRNCVAISLCNRDFEGAIANVGDTVKINGVLRPTVAQYIKGSTVISPENLGDQSTNMTIDKSDYFAFLIDNIDKQQAQGNIMSAQMQQAAQALAESADSYIYGKYADAGSTIDCTGITSANVLSKIMAAFGYLWDNNVPSNASISIEASSGLMQKILLAKLVHGMPNDTILQNGLQGSIAGLLGSKVFLTNGIYNDGTFDYCFVRTTSAIGFADQIAETKAYNPESSFSDAVKGLHLYGGKVLRPKELAVLKCSYTAETTI